MLSPSDPTPQANDKAIVIPLNLAVLPSLVASQINLFRQHGPKPSPLFTRCSTDDQLAWILRVDGAEGVIEFCLARAEMTRCRYEKERWLKHVRCAEKLQSQLIKLEQELSEQSRQPMTWAERRQVLIQREQQRRYGEAHRGLERSWTKPSTQRQLAKTR
ncbi:MAG: hypothetical protein L7W43_16825 [Rubripirellula sp.]|nr:hypothetical protein [Rubripirellula sp.]